MKKKNATAIVQMLDGLDIKAEVIDYSGRGMFGKRTAAIVVKDRGSVETAMKLLNIDDSTRTDNMGLDVVVY
jgi:hypothetical protein